MAYTLSKDVLDYIEKTNAQAIKLLETLCQIPAPSGKEEKRVEFVKKWFEDNGAEKVIVDDALNVICPIGCEGKKELIVFMAHTDVVFPDLTPLPLKKNGNIYNCPGIGDDTACLVLLMMVAKYLFKTKLQSDYGILIVANSCEEGLGNLKGCREIMKTYGDKVKEFYTFDGSYTHLVNRCVGSHRYEITFETEGGHSFGAFGNANAIAEMSNVITELYKCQVPVKENCKTTYNVGIVEGGTSVNTIAQSAKMLYEYRSDDKECLAIMQKFFEDTVESAKKNGKAKISVKLLGERPCEAELDREYYEKFVQNAVSVCEKYSGLPCITESGSTDCNIPASMGIPSICVGSHISKGAHTREETLDITSMPIGYKITAELILSYFK